MDEPLTPWGETWLDLADTALADPYAPLVLTLAAVKARRGDERDLRRLVSDAVELHEAESRAV